MSIFTAMKGIAFAALLIGLQLVWTGCKNTGQVSQAEAKDPVEGMVFLTFVIRNDSISENRVRLVSKTIINQKLKSDPHPSTAANRVLIRQLNAAGNMLSMISIDHPLFRRVEYPNDTGEWVSKTVELNDAEFFARVTLFAETKFIQVEEEFSGRIRFTAKFNIRD